MKFTNTNISADFVIPPDDSHYDDSENEINFENPAGEPMISDKARAGLAEASAAYAARQATEASQDGDEMEGVRSTDPDAQAFAEFESIRAARSRASQAGIARRNRTRVNPRVLGSIPMYLGDGDDLSSRPAIYQTYVSHAEQVAKPYSSNLDHTRDRVRVKNNYKRKFVENQNGEGQPAEDAKKAKFKKSVDDDMGGMGDQQRGFGG